MLSISKIIELTERFYKIAMGLETFAAEADLVSEADKYDIKDEELFNQFESFMSTYSEFVDSLKLNPENLTAEAMEESGQLIDVLNTRYERIVNNPYLNMLSDQGYDEDFDPGELTSFVQKVVGDAENRLKKIAGEDIDIGEMRAAQYANTFNQIQEKHEEGKKEEWSAKRVEAALEARRTWYRNLMFIKKVGKSHPDYARFEKYVATRKRSYESIMSDPDRKAEYLEQGKKRHKVWRDKVGVRKKELLALISNTQDPKRLAEYQTELAKIEQEELRRQKRQEGKTLKIREKKKSGTLEGLVIHLQQKLATLKSETAKAVKERAKTDPHFAPWKRAVQDAKNKMDKEPSPANQTALEEAIKAETIELANYLNNNAAVKKVKEDLVSLYAFRDAVRALQLPSDDRLGTVLAEGKRLHAAYNRTYSRIASTIMDIIRSLESAGTT